MNAKDLFSNSKKYISRKNMRDYYKNDPTFRKIMSDPKIAEVLDQPAEQRRFHDRLMESAKDGKIDVHDMRKIAYDIAHGKVRDISSTEGRAIAKEIFPDDSRRYEVPAAETSAETKTTVTVSPNKSQPKVPPAYFSYRAKSVHALSDKDKNKSGFFDAMRSVARNRK